MLYEILFVLWFFLPAGLANTAPIFAAQLPLLRDWTFPLDGYATFRGKRVLGAHKTVRGMLSGILVGMVTASVQVWLYEHVPVVKTFVPIDYTSIHPLLFGFLAAGGALMGDALKSFFKRQVGITPGKTWFPFDQLDYILGGIAGTCWYVHLSLPQYLLLLLVWFVLHPLGTFVGYEFKLKESPI